MKGLEKVWDVLQKDYKNKHFIKTGFGVGFLGESLGCTVGCVCGNTRLKETIQDLLAPAGFFPA